MISQERRVAAVRAHIDAALEICKRTRVELLYEIEEFLVMSAMIVEPNLECGEDDPFFLNIGWYDKRKGGQGNISPLQFYAVYPEDIESASQEVQDRVAEALATYRDDTHVIAFHCPELDESSFMKGVLTIHEVTHAFLAAREGRVYSDDARPNRERLIEELMIYELEKALWRERSPGIFQSLLDEMVTFVDEEHRLRHPTCHYLLGELLTRFPDPSESTLQLLDLLLGPADSSFLRIGHLRIYGQLEHIDRSDVPDKLSCKLGVMELLHQDVSSYQ